MRVVTLLCHPWLTLDASHVVELDATNDCSLLPAPILSRMKVFSIPAPNPEQSREIATQIWQQLRDEWSVAPRGMELTDSAVEALSGHAPQVTKKALREAVGWAVFTSFSKPITKCPACGQTPSVESGEGGLNIIRSP